MIAVVDYGMGNAGSILNMLAKIGAEAVLTREPDQVLAADKLILPGVGAFDEGMERLEEFGLVPVLREKVLARRAPFLGICLGMQLLARSSEEGTRGGLGWLDASCHRLSAEGSRLLRVPHMGWNTVSPRKEHPLFALLDGEARFYFVHSYFVRCQDPSDVLGSTEYGEEFTSALARDNVLGVQFHPEKSLRWGIQLFRSFAGVG